MDPETGRVLAWRYAAGLRLECHQSCQCQTQAILEQLRYSDKVLGDASMPMIPAPLASHALWQSYYGKLCAPPYQPVAPSPPAQPQLPAASALNGLVIEAEVLHALECLRMRNDKACGKAGQLYCSMRRIMQLLMVARLSRSGLWIPCLLA